jgi:hypothetical protein
VTLMVLHASFLARVHPFRIPIESVAENYPGWYLDSLLALHICRLQSVADVSISDYLYFSYFLSICLLLRIELTCLCQNEWNATLLIIRSK